MITFHTRNHSPSSLDPLKGFMKNSFRNKNFSKDNELIYRLAQKKGREPETID